MRRDTIIFFRLHFCNEDITPDTTDIPIINIILTSSPIQNGGGVQGISPHLVGLHICGTIMSSETSATGTLEIAAMRLPISHSTDYSAHLLMTQFSDFVWWATGQRDVPISLGTGKTRGLYATEFIPRGTVIFTVPLSRCITSDTIGFTSFDPNQRIALYLSFPPEKFKKYIKTLPKAKNLNNFLQVSDGKAITLRHLPGNLQRYYNSFEEAVNTMYRAVLRKLGPQTKASRVNIKNILTINYILVVSRCFLYKADHTAMVPLLDLMNSAEDPNVLWGHTDTEYTATAVSDIYPKQELQDHYGHKEPERFIIYYGFLPGTTTNSSEELLEQYRKMT